MDTRDVARRGLLPVQDLEARKNRGRYLRSELETGSEVSDN